LTRTRIFSGCLREHGVSLEGASVGELQRTFGSATLSSAGVLDVQIAPRVPEDRRIALTAAFSILFHAVLLIFIAVAALPSTHVRSVAQLRFDVRLEDGTDSEHENSPATERSASPTTTMKETAPAAVADNQPIESQTEPPPVVAGADPAPEANRAKAE